MLFYCSYTYCRKTCYADFCLLTILQFLIQLNTISSTDSQTCNNGKCMPLSQCQWFLESGIPTDPSAWCNINDYTVCCPQAPISKTGTTYYKNIKKPYAEDCASWQKEAYPACSPEGLIVAGKRANLKEFPHMALIGVKIDTSYNWFCGGSLINQRYVLTAAHCVEDQIVPNRVRLGELDYNRTDDNALTQEFEIKDYTAYPKYEPEEYNYDIAVIELDGIAQINSHVVPICLPVTNGSENGRLYTAGWGSIGTARDKTSYLQKVILERFDETNCQNIIGKSKNAEFPEYNICAGSWTDNRDTCQGDSGGPLFIEHPDIPCMYLIHGITSFGSACGLQKVPGVYTRVYPYVSWIESIVWNTSLHQ